MEEFKLCIIQISNNLNRFLSAISLGLWKKTELGLQMRLRLILSFNNKGFWFESHYFSIVYTYIIVCNSRMGLIRVVG